MFLPWGATAPSQHQGVARASRETVCRTTWFSCVCGNCGWMVSKGLSMAAHSPCAPAPARWSAAACAAASAAARCPTWVRAVSGRRPRRCELAHEFLREYSEKGLTLAIFWANLASLSLWVIASTQPGRGTDGT